MRMFALLYNVGRLVEAENQLSQCSALLDGFASLRDEARVAFQLGQVKLHLGEIEASERLALQAREWLERTGETYYKLQNLRTLALCALTSANTSRAEEWLREALPSAVELGGWLVVEICRCLVNVLVIEGRVDDAREIGGLALASIPPEDGYARAAGLLVEASLATAEGRSEAAVEAFAGALRLLDEQRLPLDLAEARVAYGQALRRLGDEAAAWSELLRARQDAVAMGARGLLEAADRELAKIEGADKVGPLASS